jgi:hypothetical protein
VYCRSTLPTLNGYLIGSAITSSYRAGIRRLKPGGTDYFSMQGINTTLGDSLFFATGDDWTTQITVSRTSSTSQFMTGNATTQTLTSTSTGRSTFEFYLLANNTSGSASGYSNANIALVWIGESLSQAEDTALRTITTTFQTTLGRANP